MFISTPGPYAALDAAKALGAGMHVFLFSDNVTLEHERALKHLAVSRGLLMMGPGCGTAVINGHKTRLKTGMMVLIEAGDRHEIRNNGRSLLKTVSVYVPPAYRDEETELPAGRGD